MKMKTETKYLPILQIGELNLAGEKVPFREVKELGYQWYRKIDKTWQPLKITEKQMKFLKNL